MKDFTHAVLNARQASGDGTSAGCTLGIEQELHAQLKEANDQITALEARIGEGNSFFKRRIEELQSHVVAKNHSLRELQAEVRARPPSLLQDVSNGQQQVKMLQDRLLERERALRAALQKVAVLSEANASQAERLEADQSERLPPHKPPPLPPARKK
eukprot:gene4496-4733_t